MDVLSLTVELGSRYPSKNHEGKDGNRFGRKSDEYRALFADVKEAAEREMARIGWEKAECECLAVITRYVPHHRQTDALNIGTAEANALTAAGVWTDDKLANPCIKQIRYDADGAHRVSIVVQKLHDPQFVRIVDQPKRDNRTKSTESADNRIRMSESMKPRGPQRYTGGPIPDGMAIVNGFIVPASEALALIRETKTNTRS